MNSNLEEELWKEIKGYEGLYAVSNKGQVKNIMNGKILKNYINTLGYPFVQFYNGNGKSKQITVHKLVAQAFLPNPLNLPQINHVDEDKTNNNVTNLEWVTASENRVHSNHQHSCKINQYTLDGELINQWDSSHEIKRELGFNNGNIISCCKGKNKQAYSFKWEYADPSQQRKYNRPIAALTKDGKYVAEYKNAAEAARHLKISTAQIYNCLNGRYKSTHGLRFTYLY